MVHYDIIYLYLSKDTGGDAPQGHQFPASTMDKDSVHHWNLFEYLSTNIRTITSEPGLLYNLNHSKTVLRTLESIFS